MISIQKKVLLLFLLLLVIPFGVFAQSIAGYSTLELTKPVTKTQKIKQRSLAKDSLHSSINRWFEMFFPETFDTTNTLSKFYKKEFIEACLKNSKEYSVIRGHTWSIEFSIDNSKIDKIISKENSYYDSLTLLYQKVAINASKKDDISTMYNSGVKALIFSMGHIGTPLKSETSSNTITDDMQKLVQSVLNRLVINFDLPVIIGTPLMSPDKPINVQINTDTILMSNFIFSGFLADGTEIISIKTNNMGTANLNSMKIPFVNTGTFLYIRPDFAKIAGLPIVITVKELGLKHTEETDQTLIFKIKDAKYKLHYKLIPSGISDIPSLLKDDKAVRAFLNDSLPLTPITDTTTDILFNISNRIISKAYPQKASRVIKTEATITINNLKSSTAKVMKTVLLKEQEFDTAQKIADGLYFWECSKTLRREIKKMLIELQKM